MSEKFQKRGIIRPYSIGPYNKFNETEQWIRLSQGCPNKCPFCYEPTEEKVYDIPEIIRNKVKIMDMNLLSKHNAISIIRELGRKKVKGHCVFYELICGIDYRFLSREIAIELRSSRFKNIRFAWDYGLNDQYKIRNTIKKLNDAGYKNKDIMIFMICNWQIPYSVCFKKLYLCAVWNIKVSDCYFDGQTPPKITPIGWTDYEIKTFRHQVRKHNQYINFGVDPEIKINKHQRALFP